VRAGAGGSTSRKEWFLRDVYGVKLPPAAGFTQALIDRGIISLGMG
jgi:hypothetical protein